MVVNASSSPPYMSSAVTDSSFITAAGWNNATGFGENNEPEEGGLNWLSLGHLGLCFLGLCVFVFVVTVILTVRSYFKQKVCAKNRASVYQRSLTFMCEDTPSHYPVPIGGQPMESHLLPRYPAIELARSEAPETSGADGCVGRDSRTGKPPVFDPAVHTDINM